MGFFYISEEETDFTVGIVSRNLAPQSNLSNSETVRISHFSKKLQNQGTNNHVAPGGRAPGLPRGRLPSYMKAARLHGRQVGG